MSGVLESRARLRRKWGYFVYAGGGDPTPYYEAGVTDAGEAIRLKPDHDVGWLTRGSLRRHWISYLAMLRQDVESRLREALDDFDRAVALNPARAEAWSERAMLLNEWGHSAADADLYERACRDLDRAIELEPGNPDYYVGRALVRLEQVVIEGDRDPRSARFRKLAQLAEDDFNEALRRTPENAEILWRRGRFFYVTALYREALADFEAAVRINPRLGPHLHAWMEKCRRRMKSP